MDVPTPFHVTVTKRGTDISEATTVDSWYFSRAFLVLTPDIVMTIKQGLKKHSVEQLFQNLTFKKHREVITYTPQLAQIF